MKKYLVLGVIFLMTFVATASAATSARQFTYGIGVYERAVGTALTNAGWRTTGTSCVFRSGRTVVYCMTRGKRNGTRERIQTTMVRVSATKIKVVITFLDAQESGIPVLVRNSVQVSIIRGS